MRTIPSGRTAGVVYLMTAVLGILALVVIRKVVVSGDPGATASNMLANESLFRLGIAADIVAGGCYVAVTALFYGLFKPVNKSLSLVAAFLGLTGCVVGIVSGVFLLAPLVFLKNAPYLSVFSGEQLRTLAYAMVRLRIQAESIAFVFFGLYCLLIGFLAYKSTFLPRTIGVLMSIAGFCWLAGSTASLLGTPLPPYLMFGAIGEITLILWLVVKGVNAQRWSELAS